MLAASVRLQLSESRRIVVVTSAHAGDERAPVVAGLGRALTGSGVPTLLVSADLRHPMLHKELDVPPGPGVGEVLDRLERDPGRERRRADRRRDARARAPGARRAARPAERRPVPAPGGAALRRGARHDVLRARAAPSTATSSSRARRCSARSTASSSRAGPTPCSSSATSTGSRRTTRPSSATSVARLDAPVLGAVLVGGTSVRYSLPLTAPLRTTAGFPDR